MAKFCVKCRAALEADAKFCDTCGAPVRAPRAAPVAPLVQPHGTGPTAAALAAPPLEINWRKVGLWGGTGIGVLVVAGGIAAFLAMPPAAPGASDVETIVNANPVRVADLTCLSNFPYDKNPVQVGSFDTNTQQWLAVLSKANIYTTPQHVGNGAIFGGSLEYSHTADGEKKIHNGKLCFADGLTVTSVQLAKPVKLGKQWHVRGTYSYGYRHADAWIQTPEAQRNVPDRFADLPKTASIALVKGEHGWEADNGSGFGYAAQTDGLNAMANGLSQGLTQSLARRVLEHAMGANGSADERAASSNQAGILSQLKSMVSGLFGSNSGLVGKWQADNDSLPIIEFTRDSLLIQGKPIPVTFDKDSGDGKRIHVRTKTGATVADIDIIDGDHFYISQGFGRARFHRVS
ncbi:hypothetical protein SAMN05443245_7636 [Paraburkholderia fungorum]|uniref:Zinc-ribbon domain-containing protein n=1 Tax=Paraburkholderia fungorum TaxID=134537 RepID=A0A1H1JZN4_9BURK|nr:zinc ribbon domain-containing protein [Paraburkholderia fungorum]SDR55240.1 hypothetical protein SAMN05443245_7636 [Paraburkholderia fungorum]